MEFTSITFFGLHLLHWLVSGLLPLVLFGLMIGYLVVCFVLAKRAKKTLEPMIDLVDKLEGQGIGNLQAIADIFNSAGSERMGPIFDKMRSDSRALYRGNWLPDPKRYIRPETIFSKLGKNSLTWIPAARLLAIGILGSLVELLLQSQLPVDDEALALPLILLPGLIGLAGAVWVAARSRRTAQALDSLLDDLNTSIANRIPVFSDQAGLALLVDRFTDYDRKMSDSIHEFNATARRLADSEMVDGIRHSVEQVMLTSVAPQIQEATQSLGNLATELTNKQDRGMHDLAIKFAEALSSDLAEHLQPINREVDMISNLMADVKNYIEIAMRAMETTRKQSEGLLADSSSALKQIANSRDRLTEDFSKVEEQISKLSDASNAMARIYQGNEEHLAGSISRFGEQLDSHADHLGQLVNEARQAMEKAQGFAAGQQESSDQQMTAIQTQVDKLSQSLGSSIDDLLGKLQKQTGSMAAQTDEISKQMQNLNSTLDNSLKDFTTSSAKYVRKTLGDFDEGLADMSERMARTAEEIRDAVDALPLAFRQSSGETPHFDG